MPNKIKQLLIWLIVIVAIAGSALYLASIRKKASDLNNEMGTKAPAAITVDQALKAVSNLPEVKTWQESFSNPNSMSKQAGTRPVISLDSENENSYIVHVYEDTPDHLATFGWYYVDKATGTVSEQQP